MARERPSQVRTPLVEDIGRGRSQSVRRKDVTEGRCFKRSTTLISKKCVQLGRNSRTHNPATGELKVRKQKNKKAKAGTKRPKGRPPKEVTATKNRSVTNIPSYPKHIMVLRQRYLPTS